MIEFHMCKTIGALSYPNNGMVKELNMVSWNRREPVYDIRTWDAEHKCYGKGVTLTHLELKRLKEILGDMKI